MESVDSLMGIGDVTGQYWTCVKNDHCSNNEISVIPLSIISLFDRLLHVKRHMNVCKSKKES